MRLNLPTGPVVPDSRRLKRRRYDRSSSSRRRSCQQDGQHRFRNEPCEQITLLEGIGVQGEAHSGVTVRQALDVGAGQIGADAARGGAELPTTKNGLQAGEEQRYAGHDQPQHQHQ
jgi:hypothetical protein